MLRQFTILATLLTGACALEPLESQTTSDLLAYPTDPPHPADYTNSITGVDYHGGPVMSGTPALHILYYGAPSTSRKAIIDDFVGSLGGSPLANVLTTYADASGAMPSGQFTIVTPPPTSRFAGNTLGDAELKSIIQNAGPVDETGLYVILGDAKTASGSFCSGACGWHNWLTIGSKTTQYAFIGDPAQCRAVDSTPSCQWDHAVSPNGDPDSDHMVNTLWHEIAEAVSDPKLNAYKPEIGDLCEGSYKEDSVSRPAVGNVQLDLDYTSNGGTANIHLGTRDYLLQPIWQNVGGGGCVRRLSLNRPAAAAFMTGDLDHTGSPDLIFRNSTTNNIAARMVDASGNAGALTHVGSPGAQYQVFGVADFDNDGAADLLWRNLQTGRISVWLMDGTSFTSHELVAAGDIDMTWAIRGVGDFDGNGRADILFLNLATNATRVWLNTGPLGAFTLADTQATSLHPGTSENADVIGTGDFDGDGKSDILWYRLDTGAYRLWTMNGASASGATIPSTGFDRVLGIVDVDGNLYADILAVQGGDVVYADPSGFTSVVGALPAPEWRFVGGSRALLGGSYLFWQNRMTGDIHRWNVDSAGHKLSSTSIVNNQSLDYEVVAY
ncbi:MAG TPA: FG-GAP-like repeat-containing protein [Kofleriaceae bacterium]|nr:FG-GAP-like repeat-containing protein [Kofleriaceae bacterium]